MDTSIMLTPLGVAPTGPEGWPLRCRLDRQAP